RAGPRARRARDGAVCEGAVRGGDPLRRGRRQGAHDRRPTRPDAAYAADRAPRVDRPVTVILPFAVNVLMNTALLGVVVPVIIAVRNVRAREFRGLSGFVGYTIPVDDLPRKYVWVRDPMFGAAREEEKAIETSEDDRRRRKEIAEDLRSKGVTRVWVTPQIPFIVVMAAGVVAGVLAGNLLFDLLFSL